VLEQDLAAKDSCRAETNPGTAVSGHTWHGFRVPLGSTRAGCSAGEVRCAECQHFNRDGYPFCGNCGVRARRRRIGGDGAAPSKAVEDLRSSLSDLLDRIRGCDIDLEDRQLLEETTRRAAVEAAKDRPNRIVLTGVLHAVGESVAGVASLATAVTASKDAVEAVFR
jgi:hypothetical protein